MHGAVSRRGITADLEAMRYEGLDGCYLMPIYGPDRAPELGGTLRQLTPEWWQMVDFALHEADRLGLKIGMHICDGFALAGGPWITPAQSMQVVVSTDTLLTLKRKTAYTEAMLPAAYEGSTGYYRDIAAYAMPLVGGYGTVTDTPRVESKTDGFEYDPATGRIKSRKACRFTLTYDRPVTVSALEITTFNNSVQALRMKVYAQADDGSLQLLKQIVPPRHGWQNYDLPTTVALPTVTTRRLCFDWTPEGSEAGSEDLDNAKWSKTLKIQSLKVISDPRIDDWEVKAGRVWRVSSTAQCATSAEAYVPADKVVRLTSGNDSVRYYSGRVLYSFDFEYKTAPATAYLLRLADLHDVATIVLNGQDCGSVWTAPYEADITRALRDGHNHIEIQVANTWSNAIDGHNLGRDPFGGIWTNAKYRKASKALLPAGILGGLQIIGVAQ